MEKVLLHICCGVCAYTAIKKLQQDSFYLEGFFFNPNIYPVSEYLKRKQAAQKVADTTGIELIVGKRNDLDWLKVCEPYSQDKEGRRRCLLCIEMRLKETFTILKEKEFNYFTSTLTISPHKNSSMIMEIGKNIGGDYFLPVDFKKENGFKKTIAAAKELNLYQQNYCGCIYSLPANLR